MKESGTDISGRFSVQIQAISSSKSVGGQRAARLAGHETGTWTTRGVGQVGAQKNREETGSDKSLGRGGKCSIWWRRLWIEGKGRRCHAVV